MKKIVTALFFVGTSFMVFAQQANLKLSNFLGYEVGSKFTRHHKIVEYCKALAQAYPSKIKLEQYGTTYEGRELYVAYISNKENIENLDAIANTNRTICGINKGSRVAPIPENSPAIVWLSYNVHGNEPSSSEAALLTLEELLVNASAKTDEWLKNVVVIIDPCLNPDGRDRYVNWYNTSVGKNPNADPQAREHQEPWPGGRTNHYNFDLNRDWAWQTQTESKARIKKYFQWMPQVHVDFHEQGFNEPYYFAPAAEPLHEVITKWQRDFQQTIGKNHAQYFDKNGWLYFTKERFDLFYPSYGDTYPTYNGSIGMTYEQGGIRAGLAIKTAEQELLTLHDRVMHHFTTSLSTIEISSKNAASLVKEFSTFFNGYISGKAGTYKTYILSSDNYNKLKAVASLLEQNNIEYGDVNGKFVGYNYQTQKEGAIDLAKYSIAISTAQTQGALATVLLEPRSKLSDSATYDITAWSLPYVFGVDGYALKTPKEVAAKKLGDASIVTVASNYGYIIPYTNLNASKYLAYLLKNGIKVRFASKPFTYDSFSYAAGTLLVLKTGNDKLDWNKWVNEGAKQFTIQPIVVNTGMMEKGADFGSPDVHLINAPRVAMLTGDQVSANDAGEIWHFFDHTLHYPLTTLLNENLDRLSLKHIDVLLIPDGWYRNLSDKVIADKLKDFVRGGGKLVVLGGVVNQFANGDWGIKNKADKEEDKPGEYDALKKYGNRDREYLHENIPGAIYKVELDNSHPLAYGYETTYYTLKQDANIYEFMKDGWNVGYLKKDNYVAGFTGFKVKNKLKDGTLFGVTEIGNGSVVFLADNPLFRLFWENGKQLFANAVFMVGQ